jgi:predicted XRE-type DNA-binding protein
MAKCLDNEKANDAFELEASSGNVFKDIGFPDEDAANLLVRTRLMSKIRDLIEASGMSQRRMAEFMGVPQPRIAEIMGMKIQYFSVDTLLKYLNRLGQHVEFRFFDRDQVA